MACLCAGTWQCRARTLSLHPGQGFLFHPSPDLLQLPGWAHGHAGPVSVVPFDGPLWSYELRDKLWQLGSRLPERVRGRAVPPRRLAYELHELRDWAATQRQAAGVGPAVAL
jgi:hypothetical protein